MFLKRATHQAKIRQKTTTVTLFYSDNIGCSPVAKDVTYFYKQTIIKHLGPEYEYGHTISFTSVSFSNLNRVKRP